MGTQASRIEAVAAKQGHALTLAQLRALRVTPSHVRAQVRAKRWQVPLPGVIVVHTGPLEPHTRWWVAVLHGGDDAVLSHETAAVVYGLDRGRHDDPVHVLVSHGRKVMAPDWIQIHRTRLPQGARATVVAGSPPVTSIQDTVLDLVDDSWLPRRAVHWVLAACQGGHVTPAALLAALGTRRRVRHRQLVKDMCAQFDTGVTTALELRFARDVEKRHLLPVGEGQVRSTVGGQNAWRDRVYRAYGVLVELDGRLGHEGEDRTFRDRARDNAAVEAGLVTLRFGWTDVADAPCACAAQVVRVLHQAGWTGEPQRCSWTCPIPGPVAGVG